MEMLDFYQQSTQIMGSPPNSNYFTYHQQDQQGGGLRTAQYMHRELPVDVPESFVGVAKKSPRYPPPKPQHHEQHQQTSPPMPINDMTTFAIPSAFNTSSAFATQNGLGVLRYSTKLRLLEQSRVMEPAVNEAFELNEDEADSAAKNYHQPTRTDLCSIYNRSKGNLNGFADSSVDDDKLANLLSIYNTIVQIHSKRFKIPEMVSRHATSINSSGKPEYNILSLLHDVVLTLRSEDIRNSKEAAQLLAILGKPEFEEAFSAFHWIVKSLPPQSIEIISNGSGCGGNVNKAALHQQPQVQVRHQMQLMDEYESERLGENETQTRVVRIQKDQALGATIKNEEGTIVIGRVVCGGTAHKLNLLHEGDEILDVNGVQMRGKSVDEVVRILKEMNGTCLDITLVTRFSHQMHHNHNRDLQKKIYVRTFFEHDGSRDRYIPCKEIGLSFKKGEILAIIDQSDPRWWQAHREGDDSDSHLAGLIPSIEFLKQRETTNYFRRKKGSGLVEKYFNWHNEPLQMRKKSQTQIPFGPDEIPYYEEVCVYYPDKYHKRPIILVGPKIGQRELVEKLLQDTNRFSSAVSHTSKPMEGHERDGIDFHFVSRAQFQADIKANKFIECGQYQNQYYGTSLEAMKEVVKSKKTCIHLVNTPSIFNFRNGRAGAELKPFFVFVKPDDSHPDKLRNIVSAYSFSQPKSKLEETLANIRAEVKLIETHYLPYFDFVITVRDIESAYRDLLAVIDKVEEQQQWIPSFWQDNQPTN